MTRKDYRIEDSMLRAASRRRWVDVAGIRLVAARKNRGAFFWGSPGEALADCEREADWADLTFNGCPVPDHREAFAGAK